MRVVVFGSSSALAIRPPRTNRDEGTYSDYLRQVLEQHLPGSEVTNMASRSNMVTLETDMEFTGMLQRLNIRANPNRSSGQSDGVRVRRFPE